MIKAILFDFDGVLTIDKTGSQSIINFLVSRTNLPYEHLKSCYYKYNNGLLYGEYTHNEIWSRFCNDLGENIDYSLLIESFENTRLDMDMINLVKQVHASYKTGLITDNKMDRIEKISEIYHFNQFLDVISVSASCGSGKDSYLIFERTLSELAVKANECVFIDNNDKSLIIPCEMGMKTILFDDENRDINQFKSILLQYTT